MLEISKVRFTSIYPSGAPGDHPRKKVWLPLAAAHEKKKNHHALCMWHTIEKCSQSRLKCGQNRNFTHIFCPFAHKWITLLSLLTSNLVLGCSSKSYNYRGLLNVATRVVFNEIYSHGGKWWIKKNYFVTFSEDSIVTN